MNNVSGINQIDLNILLYQLLTQKRTTIEYSLKMISKYLYQNREYADEIISKIAAFLDKNINNISDEIIIKLIHKILGVLQENNISITNFMNKIFPILMHIIYYCNRSMEQFNKIIKTIGNLINVCGTFASQIIESHVDSMFEQFQKEQNFKYEYTKYAMISVLTEFLKNSPVISYTKIIESFKHFAGIISNYKSPKDNIRFASQKLIHEFLILLSNRDIDIKKSYTKKIYEICIESNLKNNVLDVNIIHGMILVIRVCTERREFFNLKYKDAMEFLNRNKNHKSNIIRIAVIDTIPCLSEFQKEIFEESYFDIFIQQFISFYSSKPTNDLKSQLLITFGQLSLIISQIKFSAYSKTILTVIKDDIEKNPSAFNINILDCLSNFFQNYSTEVIEYFPIKFLSDKMFNCGFYKNHILFLNKLISLFNERSKIVFKIIAFVLNVISMIVSNKEIDLKDSLMKARTLKFENDENIESLELNFNHNFNSIQMTEQQKRINLVEFLKEIKELLTNSQKSILSYIFNIKNQSKFNFNAVMSKLKLNCLSFLKDITNHIFEKDILVFYQQHCVKLLESENIEVKKIIITLASSTWIPLIYQEYSDDNKYIKHIIHENKILKLRKQSSSSITSNKIILDNEIEYILNIIVDSFLTLILNDDDDDLKLLMLQNIDDSRYYYLLSENYFFNKLTFFLNFSNNSIKAKTVDIIGKIIPLNLNTITLFIKKQLLEIFLSLEINRNVFEKEESIVLLSFFVRYTGKYIVDYVQIIFSTLVKILKNETDFNLENGESLYHSNDILVISILSIISDLIKNKYYFKKQIEIYYKDILMICISILKENAAESKEEMALLTILSILENSEIDWKIYYDFIDLVNILIQILSRVQSKNSRLYAMRIFGFIGVMDPDKLELLMNFHQIQNENDANEYYMADEYNNYEDDEIIYRNKLLQMKNHSNNKINQNINNTNILGKIKIDFQKEINENELDTCTYHAIKALMNILQENNNQESCNRVITSLKEILANLNDNDNSVIYIILPTLINCVNNFEGNILLLVFDRILFIIKKYKFICIPYIQELVKMIEKYLPEKEYQKNICDILKKLTELFLNEMEKFLPRLIPQILEILSSKNENGIGISINIRKKLFSCLLNVSSKLSNYISLIIPEIINILKNSKDEEKYSFLYNTKSNNQNSNELIKDNNVNQNSNIIVYKNELTLRKKDDDIFIFLESIIQLPSFSQHMPKVINILLRYLETIPPSKDKIMKIFLKMFVHFRNNFLTYFPFILRVTKSLRISTLEYFNDFKKIIEKDDILEMLTQEKKKTNNNNKKRKLTSDSYTETTQNTKDKNRSGLMNIESLLNEFNPFNCSIEDDWYEWFKSSSKSLFLQSPSYVLFCCQNVSDYYPQLINELYNYAFISVWKMLNSEQKSTLISYLHIALESNKTPNEILLTILNLSEFIEREEHHHIEFLNFEKLGQVADICKAYAKALYYIENDFRNNNDFSSLEKLINLYYDLELPESAIGILKMAQLKEGLMNEDDWYLKLHQWKEALEVIEKKMKNNKNNDFDLNKESDKDLLNKKVTCLDGLSDWENLLSLGEEIENKNPNNQILSVKMAPTLAKASLNLKEWDKLKHYTEKIKPEVDEEIYEKNFFKAVISIKEEDYQNAKEYINCAREAINDKIKNLLTESYERAYKLLLANANLFDLEEIISLYNDPREDLFEENKKKMKKKWDERLQITDEDIKTYERILAIRGLVFPVEEDYDTHLKLAKICRKKDRFTTCMIVLNRLSKSLINCGFDEKVKVELSISKCLNENNSLLNNYDEAINKLKNILDNDIDKINDNLKSKIYCYYAMWNIRKIEKNLNEENVKDMINYLELSTKYEQKNYKAWHSYALLNYKFFENNNTKISYASNAIIGFTKSVCIGGKSLSKTLQDILRLIDIWFQVGNDEELNKLILESFEQIAIESWLLVIPQLLARVGIKDETIRNSLVYILKKIGLNHPRSLNYPLIVMYKFKSSIKNKTVEMILTEMKKKYEKLINECELIINELNRCALLLHEEWSDAIEESAKLYFQSNNINGMIKTLLDVHKKMKMKPETINELHFHQMFRGELSKAKKYIDDYLETKDEMNIKQAWDIYLPLFRRMTNSFSTIKNLDMENISPNLFKFSESEIEIPGLYRSGDPIVKISSFGKKLPVLNSKQHPRRIIIYGSNNKEYVYLLKGHEDIRQDERAMQLFGLVNTLLSNDPDTSDNNLFIKRFPVIPLSHNTGIIGWVPNCDTLNQLIREYRTTNKITTNIEHKLMYIKYQKFESASFITKLEVFKHALNNTIGLDLYKVLWNKSKNSETWLDRRTNYSRSLAVMSMVGYILGLGDRHPSNLMLDRISGKILHIDFGDCFEVTMKREKYPEKVPFRLTRMLIKALEVSGIEGTYRITCENVMRVLRSNKDSLIAILTAFVHDPLISFRLLIPLIMKQNKKNIDENNITSHSLKQDKIDFIKNVKIVNDNDESDLEKKRLGSEERKLYLEFERGEEVEFDDLNKIAKIVLERIIDKLQGTDFNKSMRLDIKQQVERLIRQATSHENLSQSYLGWCPFW